MNDKYNLKKLNAMYKASRVERKKIRIYFTDDDIYEGYIDCFTEITVGDDEDVPALLPTNKEGLGPAFAGVHVKSWEIIQ